MSNIVWSADRGWHDGADVTVTVEAGRIVTAPAVPNAGAWVVTHSLAGYMPESDPILCATYAAATKALRDEMTRYADEDDDATYALLIEDTAAHYDYPRNEDGSPDFGDDGPSMLATVEAILKDDGPAGADWSCVAEDGRARMIAFSLAFTATPEDVCLGHNEVGGYCDACGLDRTDS